MGIITSAHKIVLQQMVYQYLNHQRKDINDESESGYQVLEMLSQVESKYICILLNMYQVSVENSYKMVV